LKSASDFAPVARLGRFPAE